MNPVEEYIDNRTGNQREVMMFFHFLLISYENITSKIGYGLPFYTRKGPFCYLNRIKNDGVEICFYNGVLFSIDHEILQIRDRKQVAGVYYYNIEDIDEVEIKRVIDSAILFDKKRKKR